jgi:putative ABC transport system permease protein
MSALLLDLKQALRSQLRAPGFCVAAILSLALGLGANLAVFSALRAGLMSSQVWSQPERLLFLGTRDSRFPNLGDGLPVSFARYRLWREYQTACESLSAYTVRASVLLGAGAPRSVQVGRVETNYFDVYGVRPFLGRALQAGDQDAVVLTHRLWQDQFGGDPRVVGRAVQLDAGTFTVVGVLPRTFTARFNVFIPLVPSPEDRQRVNFLSVTGRLRPGMDLPQARTSFAQLTARLQAAEASEKTVTIVPAGLLERTVARYREGHRLLVLISSSVLLLACLNLSGLLLGRAVSRSGELGLRQALGATPRMLFQPMLAEALLVTLPGLLLGLLFAHLTQNLLTGYVPLTFRGLHGIGPWELGFGLLLGLLVAVLCAGLPLVLLPKRNLARLLGGARSTELPARRRARHAFLAVQVALAMAMLSGFALLQTSLARLRGTDVGFATGGRVLATLRLPQGNATEQQRTSQQVGELLTELRGFPGVASAGTVDLFPILQGGFNGNVEVPGFQGTAFTSYRTVSEGLFQTLGIPLLQGRDFTLAEAEGGTSSLLVSASFARAYFQGRNALGSTIFWGSTPCPIIGIVGDVRLDEFGSSRNLQVIYRCSRVSPAGLNLVVHTTGQPTAFLGLLRERLKARWPDVPLEGLRAVDEALDGALDNARQQVILLGLLAGLALTLTLAGIFSVLSRNVHEQRRELGVRLSLGATQGDLVRQVLRQGMRPALVGLALGLLGSAALATFLRSQLYGVSPMDLRVHGLVSLAIGAACLLACLLPALRTTRIQPAEVLREG